MTVSLKASRCFPETASKISHKVSEKYCKQSTTLIEKPIYFKTLLILCLYHHSENALKIEKFHYCIGTAIYISMGILVGLQQ